jgi:hypothetical protein
MIIINADDLGRSVAETEAALACHAAGRVSSATAMVFMRDSARAAALAARSDLAVGLHLNLSQTFTADDVPLEVRRAHGRVVGFLSTGKYALLVYNPFLRRDFRTVVEAQLREFDRLFGRPPSHVDGHQHQHLCSNVLLDGLVPAGQRVRRSFSFGRGEKSGLNRMYRGCVDRLLARRHRMTDFFFALEDCLREGRTPRVLSLAETTTVELMTHPVKASEFRYLMSDEFCATLRSLRLGSYLAVN